MNILALVLIASVESLSIGKAFKIADVYGSVPTLDAEDLSLANIAAPSNLVKGGEFVVLSSLDGYIERFCRFSDSIPTNATSLADCDFGIGPYATAASRDWTADIRPRIRCSNVWWNAMMDGIKAEMTTGGATRDSWISGGVTNYGRRADTDEPRWLHPWATALSSSDWSDPPSLSFADTTFGTVSELPYKQGDERYGLMAVNDWLFQLYSFDSRISPFSEAYQAAHHYWTGYSYEAWAANEYGIFGAFEPTNRMTGALRIMDIRDAERLALPLFAKTLTRTEATYMTRHKYKRLSNAIKKTVRVDGPQIFFGNEIIPGELAYEEATTSYTNGVETIREAVVDGQRAAAAVGMGVGGVVNAAGWSGSISMRLDVGGQSSQWGCDALLFDVIGHIGSQTAVIVPTCISNVNYDPATSNYTWTVVETAVPPTCHAIYYYTNTTAFMVAEAYRSVDMLEPYDVASDFDETFPKRAIRGDVMQMSVDAVAVKHTVGYVADVLEQDVVSGPFTNRLEFHVSDQAWTNHCTVKARTYHNQITAHPTNVANAVTAFMRAGVASLNAELAVAAGGTEPGSVIPVTDAEANEALEETATWIIGEQTGATRTISDSVILFDSGAVAVKSGGVWRQADQRNPAIIGFGQGSVANKWDPDTGAPDFGYEDSPKWWRGCSAWKIGVMTWWRFGNYLYTP